MKIEITNTFLKEVTKALKKEFPYSDGYLEISNVEISFICEAFYTLEIHWGCVDRGIHHSNKLSFFEDASIEYIRGMFARVVLEASEGVVLNYDN